MANDYEDFERWLTERTVRRTGSAPAVKTLVGYTMRLRGAQRIGGFPTAEHLASCLGDRAAVVQLTDKLYAQQKPVTVSGVVQALRHFGDFAVARGLISVSEVRKDDTPTHVPQKPIEVLTAAELEKLLLYARCRDNLRFYVLLATLAETGRRIGEMLALRYDDMKLTAEPPHFDLPFTKSKRQQYVPLTRLLREEVWTPENIEKLRSERGERLHGVDVKPFPWSYKGVEHHLKKLCAASGVECQGFHLLRHTRATMLLAKGVPIAGVSSLLGHANVATTDRVYSHVNALDFTRYID
jgi:integrase